MSRTIDILFTDLRHLIADLGCKGGVVTPSIYDTAQVSTLHPHSRASVIARSWLLDQQRPDGGWGDPTVPNSRDVPTLAAALALYPYRDTQVIATAVSRALAFLENQAVQWSGELGDDIPVGVELLLPRLLEEAAAMGMALPRAPYSALISLGDRRRRMIGQMALSAGTTPTHSWESFGSSANAHLIDGSGGVGHSPAATAAWLRLAAADPELAPARAQAYAYLDRAAQATGSGTPGVYPTVWPIDRFEQCFGLYELLLGGLIDHPALADVVTPQIDALHRAIRPTGIGMSDHFMVDGDITATTLAVLISAGRPVDPMVMERFSAGDHYFTYPGELQPSLSTTAHAIHALSLAGIPAVASATYLVERQLPDGRWDGDKWHASWLYTTSQIIIALCHCGVISTVPRAIDALLSHQRPDGGWGMRVSTREETAHAIFALRTFAGAVHQSPAITRALMRADHWLLAHYRPFDIRSNTSWTGKELYVPYRVAHAIELTATLAASMVTATLDLSPRKDFSYAYR